ncbi:MAG: hypothetical protein ACK5LS_08535 [Propioniciclava sp.]
MASENRRRRWRWVSIVGVVVVVTGVVVGLVVSGADAENPDPSHPVGDPDVWLDARYQTGATTWTTSDAVVGVGADRTTVLLASHDDLGVRGVDLMTGDPRWEVEDLMCVAGGTLDGVGYCLRGSEAPELVRVDDAGTVEPLTSLPAQARSVVPLGQIDDSLLVMVRQPSEITVMRVGADGAVDWERELPMTRASCHLLQGHVGCSGPLAYAVVDSTTGEVTVPVAETPADMSAVVRWATDGFAVVDLRHPQFTMTAPTYDLTGQESGSVAMPRLLQWPAADQRVYYPMADLALPRSALAVAHDGTVITEGVGQGEQVIWPGSLPIEGAPLLIKGVSADGELILVVENQALSLYSRAGEVIQTWEEPGGEVGTADGIVVAVDDAMISTVYAPGAV